MNDQFWHGFEKQAFNPVGAVTGAWNAVRNSGVGQWMGRQFGKVTGSGFGQAVGQTANQVKNSRFGQWGAGQMNQVRKVVKANPIKSVAGASALTYGGMKMFGGSGGQQTPQAGITMAPQNTFNNFGSK